MTFRISQSPSSLLPTAVSAALVIAMLSAACTPGVQAQTNRTSATPAVPQASTQQSPFGGAVVEDVIARVNDQIITRSDYERAEQDLDQRSHQDNLSPQEVAAQRKDLLRDLIDQQLLLSKGKELDINGETELIRALNEIRKQNHLDTMDDLQKAAEAQGVNYEDFKASIRNRIISQQVIRDEVSRRMNITPSDIQRYYEQHKEQFNKPESVHLDEIMVPVADPAATAAAQAKADDFEAKLKAGADFDELVKQSNAGSANPQGGDLGTYVRGKLPKVLEDQTFALKAGEFTTPIRTRQGLIILKVVEHTPGGQSNFKDVEPQVEDALAQERIQPAVRAYLARLRMEAYLPDPKPGFVDSAAVVNPNRIVYSAYTPPSPKKKKKTVRTRFRGRSRAPGKVETAKAPATSPQAPTGVPNLAQVPQGDGAPAAPPAAPALNASTTASATAAPTAAPAAVPEPTGKTRESSRKKSSETASNTMKAGKKEKIRFGQAPRETLPDNDGTRTVDAHSAAPAEAASPENMGGATAAAAAAPSDTQVASNNTDVTEAEAVEAPKEKKRFSARAKLPKPKKPTTPAVDPLAPTPETPEETATRKAQDQPLGLAGDTAKPVKKKKVKATEKTRLQDQPKVETPPPPPPDETAPVATQPPIVPPAPLDTNPTTAPPTNSAPVPTPGDGSSTTPPQPPQ